MSKVYQLTSDLENFSFFIEKYTHVDNTFLRKYWEWKEIDLTTYEPVKYELCAGDNGKKNYQMDVSTFSSGIIIFSEKAIDILKDILEKTGQIVPIITESKRKKFFGFYANKNIYDDSIINFEKSEWRQAEKGKIINKVVLNNKYPKEDYLFVVFDEPMTVFVTEKFKELVENNDLKGFEFNDYTEIKVED
jgi:hypothetical protein